MSLAVGGEPGSPPRRAPRRIPHVVTDLGEVHTAVETLLGGRGAFCFDVETLETDAAKANKAPNPRTNRLGWIGIGGAGRIWTIPVEHPLGVTLTRTHKEKTPAYTLYGPDDERSYTPTTRHLPPEQRKPSWRKVEHTVEATFAPPPKLLGAHEVMAALRPLLFSKLGKIGHNTKFDLMTCAAYFDGEIPPGPYHDTLILRHVLDENIGGYALKSLARNWLSLTPKQYPEMGKEGVENFGIDDAARYLTKDVRYTWLMFRDFYPRLKRKGLQAVYDFEMSLYPALMGMEQAGFPVERGNLDKVRRDLEKRIAEIEREVYQAAGGQFHLSNTNARRWVMFGEGDPAHPYDPLTGNPVLDVELQTQGLQPLSYTEKTHTAQITQGILQVYADRGNKMAANFLDWSLHEKLRGTFIEGLGPMLVTRPTAGLPTIHTSFNQHGTATGRLSSSKPNIQNLPRGTLIRDLFVADLSYVLISADYDQIELRALAYEARERNMIKVFKDGRDIHREAAAAAMRIDAERITDEQRQVGKTLNFATGYGAGPGRIAMVAGVSLNEGKAFLDRYYAQFPELQRWKNHVLRDARQFGDRADVAHPPAVVIPPFGRLRRLPELFNVHDDGLRKRAERQAVNAVIQGFASYITKMAMIQLHEILPDYGAWMVLQVHDEIVVRVKEKRVGDVLPVLTSTMAGIRGTDGKPILGDIPLVVSAGTGYTWAEAKGK